MMQSMTLLQIHTFERLQDSNRNNDGTCVKVIKNRKSYQYRRWKKSGKQFLLLTGINRKVKRSYCSIDEIPNKSET